MQSILITEGNRVLRDGKANSIVSKYIKKKANNSDFYVVEVSDDKNSISIGQTRKMISVAQLKPRYGDYCVIWIREAQYMTIEAQNSVLKVLEEPPSHLVFILTADHSDNLIKTVVSRCKVMKLEIDFVFDVVDKDKSKFINDFLVLLSSDPGQRLDWVEDNKVIIKDRALIIEVLSIWETVIRDLAILNSGVSLHELYNKDFHSELQKMVFAMQQGKINTTNLLHDIAKIKTDLIRSNINSQLAIETLLLKI